MKEILNKITKWFENIKIKKITYEKEGIKPINDWHFILLSTFILVCIMAAVAYYFFVQINNGKLFLSNNEVPVKSVIIDNVLLKKTVDEIIDREKKSSEFKQNRIIPANPSI